MQDRGVAQQADICRRYGTEIHVPEAGSKHLVVSLLRTRCVASDGVGG